MKLKVLITTSIMAFALSVVILLSQVGVVTAQEPWVRYYALGYDEYDYTLGCKAKNTVYWPYVSDGHVSESVWCAQDGLNGIEVGWQMTTSFYSTFFTIVLINGYYYPQYYTPCPDPWTDHTLEGRNVVEGYAPTNVWRAYIDGVLKREASLPITYAENHIAQSESTNTVNEFDGHFWNLKFGGLSAPPYPGGPRYFRWFPWYSTQWYDDDPYEVISISDTEFYTEGP